MAITERFSLLTVIALLSCVVLAHLGLIDLGQWQEDDYQQFLQFRREGLHGLINFTLYWRPFIFSNTFLFIYHKTVQLFHGPHTGLSLSLCWLTLMASTFTGIRSSDRKNAFLYRLLLALSLFSMFLLGYMPGEVYYWIPGAAAYIFTLAAITAYYFTLANSPDFTPHTYFQILLLLIACSSSEMGAVFVLSLSVMELISGKLQRKREMEWVYWALPFCISAVSFVLLFYSSKRVGSAAEASTTHDLAHHLGKCIITGIQQFLVDLLAPSPCLSDSYASWLNFNTSDFMQILTGLITKISFLFAFGMCWKRAGFTSHYSFRALGIFIIALLVSCFVSHAASDYQYGESLGMRHESLRQSFIILALAALAVSPLGERLPQITTGQERIIPVLIIVPVIILFLQNGRMHGLVTDYKNYSLITEARNKTWASGLEKGKTEMNFYIPPLGRVVEPFSFNLQPGFYTLQSDKQAMLTTCVLPLFGKQSVHVINMQK